VFNIRSLAFPYNKNFPAKFVQFSQIVFVTFRVSSEFRNPVAKSGFWQVGIYAALMPMPKATTDLNNFLKTRKNEIRLAWQFGRMKPKPIAHRMGQSAYRHFRLHPLTSDPAHVFTAPFG
jgi:hypothetical protein